jgi:hypothetical protein
MSASGSNSPTRLAISPSGISFAPGMLADLVFVRLAHVDQHEVVAAVQLRFTSVTSISPSFTLASCFGRRACRGTPQN